MWLGFIVYEGTLCVHEKQLRCNDDENDDENEDEDENP